MPDIVLGLMIFGLVVLFLALIGHGIWVFLSFVFRGFRPKRSPRQTCCFCGRQTAIDDNLCQWCAKSQNSPLAEELRDLEALQRQLRRFQINGALKPETVTNLLERVKGYRGRLLRPKVDEQPVVKPQPVVTAMPTLKPAIATLVTPEIVAEPTAQREPNLAKPQAAAGNVQPQATGIPAKPQLEAILLKSHATEVSSKTPVPPIPAVRPPRKSIGDVLGSFLKERDIHWSELAGVLIGGLLMVGASVAFVIAYWSNLQEVQTLKFSIFVGYSSIVFATGLFVFHRWKLQSTGRGLMTIGILLAPLNFLAMASDRGTPFTIFVELVGLGMFGWLTALAAKALTRGGQWPLVSAVIGNSALILLVGQFTGGIEFPLIWMTLGFLPAGILAITAMWHLAQVGGTIPAIAEKVELAKREEIAEANDSVAILSSINSLFLLLAVSVYSSSWSLGLIAAQASRAGEMSLRSALELLAPPLCLAAIPVLSIGLFLQRRIPRRQFGESEAPAESPGVGRDIASLVARQESRPRMLAKPNLEAHRTVATAIAILGVLMQIGALFLAWPQPMIIAAVGVIAAGCLAFVALRCDFPIAHAGAMFGATLAYLAIFFVVADGKIRPLEANDLFDARCGTALAGAFFVFAAVSELFVRRGRKSHGVIYAAGSCLVAALGMLLVTWHGLSGVFDNSIRAAALYGVYGIVCLLLSMRWNRESLSYIGWNLLAAAPMWLLSSTMPLARYHFALAGCFAWVAAVWLALAWRHRSAAMFTLQQIVLSFAGLFAGTAWLVDRGWVNAANFLNSLTYVYNLQVLGVALAALSLGWLIVRIATRRSERFQKLLNPAWLPFDKVLSIGLVIFQAMLLAPSIFSGISREISLSRSVGYFEEFCGPAAWIFLVLLIAINLLALWERWERSSLIAGLLLAATVPCLMANHFAAQAANASALRWGMAVMFLLVSAAIWFREQLHKILLAWGARIELDSHSALLSRVLCASITAVPVVAITVFIAMEQLTGTTLSGPLKGCFFAAIGPSVSYLVPLVLVIVATVGHAVRESSAINAFLAGLVVELAVMLGYPLYLSTSVPRQPFQETEFMVWLQLLTIAPAVWALGWLIVRRRLNVWRESPTGVAVSGSEKIELLSSALMNVQIGFGFFGNFLLLGIALAVVIFVNPTFGNVGRISELALAEGMPLGWCALALSVAASSYRSWQRGRSPRPDAVGLTGMGILALLACTVPNLHLPEGVVLSGPWAYRVLMIGWASYALLIALTTWWVAAQRTLPDAEGPPQAIIRMAAVWVRVAGIAAVLLGLKAGFLHDDYDGERLWAAAGIALAGIAGATMAIWRRREGWAFAAALSVNVAASLVVWHFEALAQQPFESWWLRLVQANAIASAAVGLVWLAAHRRLYQLRDWSVRECPLLAVQIALPILANAAILLVPVVSLVRDPSGLPDDLRNLANAPGWLSLMLAALAAGWYCERTMRGNLLHVLGGLGFGAGVLFACRAAAITPDLLHLRIEYHVLYTAWTVVALTLLGLSFAANRLTNRTGESIGTSEASESIRNDLATFFSASLCNHWVTALGLLVAGLVIRGCPIDKEGVWWSMSAMAAVSFAVGAIALWQRSPGHVYFSGVLLNMLGVAAWFAWGRKDVSSFLEFQALCLSAAAAIWALLDILFRGSVPHFRSPYPTFVLQGERGVIFAHLAIGAAVFCLAVPAAYGLFGDLSDIAHSLPSKLGWIALASVAGVFALMLWDRRARYVWLGVYITGIVALMMLWESRSMTFDMLCWRVESDLSGYTIIAALVGRFMPWIRRLGRYAFVPDGENRWAGGWFTPLQAVLATVASLLSVWIVVDPRFNGVGREVALFHFSGHAAGATSLLMLLGATVLMASQCSKNVRENWQYAAFVMGFLFISSVRIVNLDANAANFVAAPWLHRSIAFLLSAAMMCLLTTFGLPLVARRFWARFFPRKPDDLRRTWTEAGQKMLPYFAGLTITLLAFVLVQEGAFFDPNAGAPATIFETISIAVVMAVMFVLVLFFALRKDFDPLNLSDSGRQAYVYAAEVLLALIGLHVWLTNPHLFQLGIVRRYWMFLVTAIAFAGAGLSEIFHRRKLHVLSLPLERTAMLLPILPAVGFWFLGGELSWALIGRTPFVWFVIGGFYATMASMRRSWLCGVPAVITANMGIWTGLMVHDISFFERPQLWLIPIALCALVAEFLNHERLSKSQSTVFRYAALSTIYVSSTAEMFMSGGISEHPGRPLVLLLLAVTGALSGVVLKIRSFLILGVVFLLIDLISLITYAAHDLGQTWIWYVSCILLGAGIIAVFAFFEKRRNDVVAAMEKLKKWER